nr:RNA-directed DNA polymerase, eukaryota, reverse transcriptase zinc-binding domain protein [Tanacetum cinerariifolium]
MKIENYKLMILKMDFEKAFDSVNWMFLQVTMRQMGFGVKWRNKIDTCLRTPSISILVYGSPSHEFKIERGVSLADEGANISLLQYVDDALFFGEWSRHNAKNLIHVLNFLERALGPKINLYKSRLFGVGTPTADVEAVASSLGFLLGKPRLSQLVVGSLLSNLFLEVYPYITYRYSKLFKKSSISSNQFNVAFSEVLWRNKMLCLRSSGKSFSEIPS